MGKQKITMTIDEKVFAAFKQFCKERGMKVSSKVELLMRDAVEHDADSTTPGTTVEKRRERKDHDKKEGPVTRRPPEEGQ